MRTPEDTLRLVVLVFVALFVIILGIIIFRKLNNSQNKSISEFPENSTTVKELLILLGIPMFIYTVYALVVAIVMFFGTRNDPTGAGAIMAFIFMGMFFLVPIVSISLSFFLKRKALLTRKVNSLYFFFWSLFLFPFSFVVVGFLAWTLSSLKNFLF